MGGHAPTHFRTQREQRVAQFVAQKGMKIRLGECDISGTGARNSDHENASKLLNFEGEGGLAEREGFEPPSPDG